MKKVLCIIMCLFIFSGCTVNYDLEINNNIVDENIYISENLSKFDETIADSNIENAYSSFKNNKIIKYKNSKEKNGNSVTYNLYQTYALSDSVYLRTFTECFDAYKFIYADSTKTSYIIQTSEGFKCMDYEYQKIDSYKIKIKTNHVVINHNADEVNGNEYIWNIDSSNASTKSIKFEFKKEGTTNYEKKNNKKNDIKLIFIIVGICILLILVLILYIFSINAKRNKI